MGAIGTKEKNHGSEETDEKAEDGQEAPTDDAAANKSQYGRRKPRQRWMPAPETTLRPLLPVRESGR